MMSQVLLFLSFFSVGMMAEAQTQNADSSVMELNTKKNSTKQSPYQFNTNRTFKDGRASNRIIDQGAPGGINPTRSNRAQEVNPQQTSPGTSGETQAQ